MPTVRKATLWPVMEKSSHKHNCRNTARCDRHMSKIFTLFLCVVHALWSEVESQLALGNALGDIIARNLATFLGINMHVDTIRGKNHGYIRPFNSITSILVQVWEILQPQMLACQDECHWFVPTYI